MNKSEQADKRAIEAIRARWFPAQRPVFETQEEDNNYISAIVGSAERDVAALLTLAEEAIAARPLVAAGEVGLPARGTPAWDAEYEAACDSRSWDVCELLLDRPWATSDDGLAVATRRTYAIVIEWAETNYSAYVPDVPGCVTTGATVEETIAAMREALEAHLTVMREHGEPISKALAQVATVDVAG